MCTLVFLVLTELSPGVAILVLNGVFIVQIIIDVQSSLRERQCINDNCNLRRRGYRGVNEPDNLEQQPLNYVPAPVQEGKYKHFMKFLKQLQRITDFYAVKIVAGLLQVIGVVGLIGYWIAVVKSGKSAGKPNVYLHPLIGLPFVLLTLSTIWSNRFQEAIARSNVRKDDKKISARYKSSKCFLSKYFTKLVPTGN